MSIGAILLSFGLAGVGVLLALFTQQASAKTITAVEIATGVATICGLALIWRDSRRARMTTDAEKGPTHSGDINVGSVGDNSVVAGHGSNVQHTTINQAPPPEVRVSPQARVTPTGKGTYRSERDFAIVRTHPGKNMLRVRALNPSLIELTVEPASGRGIMFVQNLEIVKAEGGKADWVMQAQPGQFTVIATTAEATPTDIRWQFE